MSSSSPDGWQPPQGRGSTLPIDSPLQQYAGSRDQVRSNAPPMQMQERNKPLEAQPMQMR